LKHETTVIREGDDKHNERIGLLWQPATVHCTWRIKGVRTPGPPASYIPARVYLSVRQARSEILSVSINCIKMALLTHSPSQHHWPLECYSKRFQEGAENVFITLRHVHSFTRPPRLRFRHLTDRHMAR